MKFNEAQIEALRRICEDWIAEGFTTPPYEPAYYDIWEKLGLDPMDQWSYDIRRPKGSSVGEGA